DHQDVHYCFASVKAAREFAVLFPTFSVIVSQDDKAKKLTLSVYLIIDPSDTNDTLRKGQLSIYIRPQYKIETSLVIHMNDLYSLMNNGSFDDMLKVDNKIGPIWVLLVDGGPDENPRYLKNITQYCDIFYSFDLDYLTVRTHAPGHSVYNPVERSMASLSTKLAAIVLSINKYSTHLDSQSKVVDPELAEKNFKYADNLLCNLWNKDKIFRKPVLTEYIDTISTSASDISWE
ncbi:3187_t:CDS:2, partial [Scutellospora calospora]